MIRLCSYNKGNYISRTRKLFEFTKRSSFFLKSSMLLFILFTSYSWGQQAICFGSVKKYGVDRNENLGLGTRGSVYNWTIRDSRFVGEIIKTYTDRTNEITIDWGDTPEGDYVLEVNETNNGCTGLNQLLPVTIESLPFVNLTNQYVCLDPKTNELLSPALLDTKLSDNTYSFKWQLDGSILPDTAPSITVDKTGSYKVEITNRLTGCTASDIAMVEKSSPSVAAVSVENIFMDTQNIVIKVIKGIGDYEYAIDGVTFQDTPVFSVSKSGVYPVVIRDKNGCNDMFLTAHVIKCPKFFTPNSDGYNDIWKVEDLLPSMNSRINIFDRYGKLLKSMNVTEEGWDGTYNGRPMFADDYWFTIDYIASDGNAAVFKSHFALKR